VAEIEVGYLGIVEVGGTRIRCNNMGSTPTQQVLDYKHIYGLNDSGSGSTTKGETIGAIIDQKILWRPGMYLLAGSFSFPADEDNAGVLYDYIKTGEYVPEIKFKYSCGTGIAFQNCRLSQFTLSVTAGDMLNISVSFVATSSDDIGVSESYEDAKKLITWDKVDITGADGNLQSVNLNITNEIIPIYTVDGTVFSGNEFGPRDLRIGEQNVSGVINTYLKPIEFTMNDETEEGLITIVAPNLTIGINAVKTPLQVSTSTGVFYAGEVFTGVGRALI